MGNRACIVFFDRNHVSPTVYLHWHGDAVPDWLDPARAEGFLRDLAELARERGGAGALRDEVIAKGRDLMTPVLGAGVCAKLIEKVFALENVKDIKDLRPLLQRT